MHLPDAVRVPRLVPVQSFGIQTPVALEMPHGQLQDVGLLQFGVFGVVRLGRVQDEGLEGGQTLVDPGAAPLLHQGLVGAPGLRGGALALRRHHCELLPARADEWASRGRRGVVARAVARGSERRKGGA